MLSKEKIEKNTGLKEIAKLMLNSHWGRYAMKTNKVQANFVTNYADFVQIFLINSTK